MNISFRKLLFFFMTAIITQTAFGEIQVVDSSGMLVKNAMVTKEVINSNPDKEYLQTMVTKFSDKNGLVNFPSGQQSGNTQSPATYRVRAQGFKDQYINSTSEHDAITITIHKELDPALLAASKPASNWAASLEFPDEKTRKHFMTQCTYCHQQGNQFTRRNRSEEDWKLVIARMTEYGSRLSTETQEIMPKLLVDNYKRLHLNPELVSDTRVWDDYVSKVEITEWKIGDAQSNMHDLLLGSNGIAYVGDDVKGQIHVMDVTTGKATTHTIPFFEGDERGGPLGFDLSVFPEQSEVRVHSLAESAVDGHIFTTDPRQTRIHEFNPKTKEFKTHQIPEGLFPHTIRIDQKDRVWFTMAASNHIGMLDRTTNEFTMYELPTRNFMEWLQLKLIKAIVFLAESGVSFSALPINKTSDGFPFPYGIDVAPDGSVWFARLHANDIGKIDSVNGEVTMIPTPFVGPRRMRSDNEGNIWVTAYAESKIAKYNPIKETFEMFELPVVPTGSEIPYALNIDHDRDLVWVTGTSTDSLMSMHMQTKEWKVYPLPRKGSYTRELEIMKDGSVLTSTSSNPAWQEEGAIPTVVLLKTQ